MDLLTRAELESLAEGGHGDVHVSMFMPTHRFGGGITADKLRWKNLVAGVEAVLAQQMRRPEVEAFLAPARDLQDDELAWQHMSDGLAMFLRQGWQRTYRVPVATPALATVGDRTVMGPMLRLLSGDEHFLLLALSQREIRLMEGSRNSIEAIQLGDVPTNLADVVADREPRSDSMARPGGDAGRGGPAVFYGSSAPGQEVKKDEVIRFVREVSDGLRDLLAGQTAPLVLVGLEHLVSAYREVGSYGNVLEQAVIHNADQLSPDQLHAMAWPLIEQRLRDDRSQVVARFNELQGTGLASSDLRTVLDAAATGRIDTLFVKADPWCWESVSGDSSVPVVQLGTDQRYAACEQVDAAAIATLNNGGRVYATSQPVAPDSEVAGIFRY